MLFFFSEVIADKPFQDSGVTMRLWCFQHATALERSIEVGWILSYSFDLQSCLHKYKRPACRACGNALEKFDVKFAKKN